MKKVKQIKPLNTKVLISACRYSLEEMAEDGDIIDATKVDQPLKEYQKVITKGPMVRNVEVGDWVKVDPKNYAQRQYSQTSIKDGVQGMNPIISYNFPIVFINEEMFLLVDERDLEFIVEFED